MLLDIILRFVVALLLLAPAALAVFLLGRSQGSEHRKGEFRVSPRRHTIQFFRLFEAFLATTCLAAVFFFIALSGVSPPEFINVSFTDRVILLSASGLLGMFSICSLFYSLLLRMSGGLDYIVSREGVSVGGVFFPWNWYQSVHAQQHGWWGGGLTVKFQPGVGWPRSWIARLLSMSGTFHEVDLQSVQVMNELATNSPRHG